MKGRDLIIKIVEKPRRSVANAGGRWRLTIDENVLEGSQVIGLIKDLYVPPCKKPCTRLLIQ